MANADGSGLAVDAHCAMLTDHIRDKSAQMMDGFKHFVQLYAAILGGSVAIRLQYGAEETTSFAVSANLLVALVAVVSSLIIFENYRSWIGFRRTLSVVAGLNSNNEPIVPLPNCRAGLVHWVLFGTMFVATISFWCWNPLLSSAPEEAKEASKVMEGVAEKYREGGDLYLPSEEV